MEVKLLLLTLFIFAFTGAFAGVFVNNDEDPFPDSSSISDHRSLSKREEHTDTTVTDNNESTTLTPAINTSPWTERESCWIEPNMSSDDLLNKCYKAIVFIKPYSSNKEKLELNLTLLTDDDLNELFSRAIQIQVRVNIRSSASTALRFPSLESFPEGLTVSDNLNLSFLETLKVKLIKGQELVVENNPQLERIQLPFLEKVDLTKGLFIKNNHKLWEVNFGNRMQNPSDFSVGGKGVEIVNNRGLKIFELGVGRHNKMDTSISVNIIGNPNLKKVFLDDMKTLFSEVPDDKRYIQGEGECVFPEPLVNLEDLRICKYVFGDLVISPHADNFTTPTPSFQLAEVKNGSIVINGTNLSDLPIFNGTKTDGLVISNSCTTMSDIVNHNISYQSLAYFNNTCPRNCTPIDLLTFKQPDCEVVVGDIIMEWIFYKEEDVRVFKSIKKVIGKIVLNGIYPEINVTIPLMFDNLEEIITPNGGTSMELWNLRYTDKFIAPRLKTVKNPDRHFLVMKGNDFLRSLEECLRLEANLSSRQFDPRDLIVQGLVTELVPIDEDSLHFYDDQERGADAVFLPVILLIPSFFILYD